MLADIDVLVVDLQDVGSRYYTFIWTLELCMQACHEAGKTVVVLDRPNPISGQPVEGPMLKPEFASFVGLRPLPVRHGMTIGEIGTVPLRIHSIPAWTTASSPCRDGSGRCGSTRPDLPWVMPSPNMPTLDTALVYPGMCLLEGTNISEGTGHDAAVRDLRRALYPCRRPS